MDDLLADFLTETHEGLLALDAALVRLERAPDDKGTLAEVFRVVHTIKGTCGFLGLPRLEAVAHAAENVLGRWRDGSLGVTQDGISRILQSLDAMRRVVAGLEAQGAEPAGDDAGLISALNALAEGQVATAAPPPSADGPPLPPAATGPDEAAEPPLPDHHLVAPALEGALPVPAAVPEQAASAPVPSPEAPMVAADGGAANAGGGVAAQTIRVAVEVLEDLMTLVSELVLTRNQLLQTARQGADNAFAAPLQRLSQITSELQEGVMKTRMQPIGNAWAKLPRLVRDLGVELGKRIELEMRGAETELDRQVLELIKDPLTHMVRNSADHGLETPDKRRAAGKPETGRIFLNAYHEGGHIILEVGDDGRGLDLDRIRQKVVNQGLATEAELATMSEREIMRFIFRPGFSTAAAITAVSGRGVGMDVVKTNMERIGGTIEVGSRPGHGTTFVVKIPLTLAIVSALIVEAGADRFAIPQIGVVELVRLGGEGGPRIERIKDAPVMRLRDRLLPLVNLSGLLQLDQRTEEEKGFVVVSQVGMQVFGIIVDRVFDTEEIVVKPVAPILRHLTLFSGNTILGDGSVIMILDLNGIARTAGLGADGASAEAEAAAAAAERQGGLGAGSMARTALLLFRAGDATPKAVPLGLVARLETVERGQIESAGGRPLVQYRGKLMPLVPLDPVWDAATAAEQQPVLVFGEGERAMGLVVEEILDVIEERLAIDPAGARPGFLGSAVLSGRVTELIDTAWWLRQAGEDWFAAGPAPGAAGPKRLLVVEDSAFFRNLVVPALGAAGYAVTAVAAGQEALRLREAGEMFDAVVSDIVMPDIDGLALVQAIRQGGPWQDLPVVALSGRAEPADVERGRAAGFTDYVAKFDRTALLESLQQCLAPPVPV